MSNYNETVGSGSWGGFFELRLLGNSLNHRFIVHRNRMSIQNIVPGQTVTDEKTIRLLFTGDYYMAIIPDVNTGSTTPAIDKSKRYDVVFSLSENSQKSDKTHKQSTSQSETYPNPKRKHSEQHSRRKVHAGFKKIVKHQIALLMQSSRNQEVLTKHTPTSKITANHLAQSLKILKLHTITREK